MLRACVCHPADTGIYSEEEVMIRISVLSAVLLALTLACGLASAQGKQVVRFQEYPGSVSGLVGWVMKDRGFCEIQGLDCQAVLLASGPLGQQAAAAGSVDVIVSSADVMMQAISKGNDIQLLSSVIANNLYSLSVSAELPTPNRAAGYPALMKDLVDKKIGVTVRGSSTEMFVKALLSGAGIPPDKVTYVAVGGPGTAFAALNAKQVDAVLSWDPLPIMCGATKVCNVAVDMTKGEGPAALQAMNGGFVVWGARRDYIQKNGATVDRFIRASNEALAWTKDPANYAAAKDIAQKYFKLGDVPNREQTFESMVKQVIAQYGGKIEPKVIDGFNGFLINNKMIETPLDASKIIYVKTM